MTFIKPLVVPPIAKHELLVVKEETWNTLVEHIEMLTKEVDDTKKDIDKLQKINEILVKRVKVLAEALGGVYEEE